MNNRDTYALAVFFVCLAFIIAIPLHFKRLKGHRGMALLCWLAGVVAGSCILIQLENSHRENPMGLQFSNLFAFLVARPVLWVFLLPFCVHFYFKWILGEATEEEKREGMDGVRAWLSPGNVVWALVITICSWQGYGNSFWGVFALTILALLAYPIMTQIFRMKPAEPPRVEDLSSEREKVLQLLDQGKINANESAELINALGASVRLPPVSSLATPNKRLIWIGTALVLFGFFMPWFAINPGGEVNRLGNQIQQTFPMGMSGIQFNTPTINVKGPDVQHGLGWMVLFAAIAASALPFFVPEMKEKTRHLIVLVGLGAGLLIMLSLVTQNLRFVSFGIILCLAGYAISILGAAQDWRASEYSR